MKRRSVLRFDSAGRQFASDKRKGGGHCARGAGGREEQQVANFLQSCAALHFCMGKSGLLGEQGREQGRAALLWQRRAFFDAWMRKREEHKQKRFRTQPAGITSVGAGGLRICR